MAVLRQPAARALVEVDGDVLVGQLRLEFEDELVDHVADGLLVQRLELDDGIQAVAELGAEELLDLLQVVAAVVLRGKAHRRARDLLGTGIRGHHDNHVAKIGLAPVVVGERAVVHHLQQQVEHVRVRLLDLVQQQHRVRVLGDGLGQQSALVEADVTGRRADEARHRVPLHVFRHVEADEFEPEHARQLARHLGLAHAGRTGEQVRADRLLRMAEPGARHLDRRRQRRDRLVLPEHHDFEIAFERHQRLAVEVETVLGGMRAILATIVSMSCTPMVFLRRAGGQLLRGAGLVDDVDRLVRQVAVVDVAVRKLDGRAQRLLRVAHAMMALEAVLQAAQDLDRLLDRRLGHVDLLEAARQRAVLLENVAVFLVGGRTDARGRRTTIPA